MVAFQFVIRDRAMHQTTVVPEQQTADAPFVGVEELRLCGVSDEVVQLGPAFLSRHLRDM